MTVLYYTVLFYAVLCYTILPRSLLPYYTVLYSTAYHTIVHNAMFCHTTLHYTMLHYTMSHHSILYYHSICYTVATYPFRAPWCTKCQELAPMYEEVPSILHVHYMCILCKYYVSYNLYCILCMSTHTCAPAPLPNCGSQALGTLRTLTTIYNSTD